MDITSIGHVVVILIVLKKFSKHEVLRPPFSKLRLEIFIIYFTIYSPFITYNEMQNFNVVV